MKGKFITIYGINNIGKSTQAKRLVRRLNRMGKKAKYVKYPVYDMKPSGPFLNSVLRNHRGQKISELELQLWFVINRHQFEPRLKKMLQEGTIVVAEDYVGTGIAWGTAKGLSENWLEEMNRFLLKEDLAILLEGSRDLRAVEKGHVHEENGQLIKKCIQQFSRLAGKNSWKRVRVRGKIEETAKIIWETVSDFV